MCRSLLVSAFLFSAACSAPPQREIDAAERAVHAARGAGAAEYASESFNAATAALSAARDAVAQRDYRLALSRALDARERAQQAEKQAADGKATARTESEAAIRAVVTALQELDQKLEGATRASVPARDLKTARATVEAAGATLQKARAALADGNYLQARDALKTTRDDIAAEIRALNESISARPPRPARRQRGR
jgi:hypothetical protein